MSNSSAAYPQVVGLVPAGGTATRIAPLPCSKEIYPVGFHSAADGTLRPKAAAHYLLDGFRDAGASRAYIVLRPGKWDIPAYLGDGSMAGLPLAYLMMNAPWGVPYTLDQAFPFVEQALVLFGFPDILFEPEDAFLRLRRHQADTAADIVLGLFPAAAPQTCDMVALDPAGRVRHIVIKPASTDLEHSWIIAVWTPAFTRFLHDYLATLNPDDFHGGVHGELFLGQVINAAIDAGWPVEAVTFPDGCYTDIGTPTALAAALRTRIPE
jgi:glucose-1-phosphate thymidylyltransferase